MHYHLGLVATHVRKHKSSRFCPLATLVRQRQQIYFWTSTLAVHSCRTGFNWYTQFSNSFYFFSSIWTRVLTYLQILCSIFYFCILYLVYRILRQFLLNSPKWWPPNIHSIVWYFNNVKLKLNKTHHHHHHQLSTSSPSSTNYTDQRTINITRREVECCLKV